jgi:hypothetical protein
MAATLGAAARTPADELQLTPSLFVGASYDDNLFVTLPPRYAAGLIVRPAFDATYRPSSRLTFIASTGFDTEYFGDSAVTRWWAGRSVALSAGYLLDPNTTVSLAGRYALTWYPGTLVPTLGFEYGRRQAEMITLGASVRRRVRSRLSLQAGYTVESLRLAGTDRELHSQFSGDTSAALAVSPTTTVTVRGGPRYVFGKLTPHVGVTVDTRRERIELSADYGRGKNVAFDRPLLTEAYSLRATYRLSPRATLSVSPGLYRHWERADEQRVWRVGAQATWRVHRLVGMHASYQYIRQALGLAARVGAAAARWPTTRSTLIAGFTVAAPRGEVAK